MSPSFLEFPEDAPQIPLEEERYAYVLSEKGALWLNNNYAHPDLLRGVEFMEGDVLLWPPSLPIARAKIKFLTMILYIWSIDSKERGLWLRLCIEFQNQRIYLNKDVALGQKGISVVT